MQQEKGPARQLRQSAAERIAAVPEVQEKTTDLVNNLSRGGLAQMEQKRILKK